jgi:hypothetical protein
VWAGIAVAVIGVIVGGALASLAASTKEDTVKKFARAPVGCTTTLEFEKVATFTLFVETKGSAIDVGGDCTGNGSSYDRADGDPPSVTLVLVDEDDNPVDLTESTAYSYDTGSFRGEAIQQADISTPGTYRLTVSSDDTDFAIAIGGDPEADSSTVLVIGGAVFLAGLLAGAILVVLGLRRKGGPVEQPPPVSSSAPAWPPQQPATPSFTPPPSSYQPPAPSYQPPAPSYQPPAPQAPPQPPAGPGWGAPQA